MGYQELLFLNNIYLIHLDLLGLQIYNFDQNIFHDYLANIDFSYHITSCCILKLL